MPTAQFTDDGRYKIETGTLYEIRDADQSRPYWRAVCSDYRMPAQIDAAVAFWNRQLESSVDD